ncbi:hypothetical protein PFICI_00347 [Pestalotiopsis fici W106-1]|uniref:T6SS Phospholipase effector Tle1-like catalytic domain-containing protein n=1 Tax=Pestalotiopsis fici (strain W106-1 / CGMCC3.15140) TaxID=1229662 RepID=W3XKH5_PESFW|nr:uncharacterized protein PFICI_00347 [Pestalotiopsis fici W106-1]ETS86519.1 hypothetical protein PFICI_00347 [Pestalotiopsis fici W106-1]
MSASPSLPAKIIICCDGTSKSAYIEGNSLTNVTRITRCIKPIHKKGNRQIVWYHPGIGTGSNRIVNAWHQFSGEGLKDIIIAAYLFLCNNYNTGLDGGPRDEIYLVGFSRGAFAVRCLASLIQQHGVLPREELHHANDLYDQWKKGTAPGAAVPPVPIKACALWDTVSAIGIPLRGGTMCRKLAHIDSDMTNSVDHVYQALALHEHRHHFFPIVLKHPITPSNAPNVEQCWFGGFHSDVGGGKKLDALAHLPLIWILSKLSPCIDTDMDGLLGPMTAQSTWRVPRLSDASFRPVDSMKALFRFLGSKYRIPNYEFWGEAGVYTCPDPNNEEKIHRSTRKLIEDDQMTLFHAALSIPTSEPIRWLLRPGPNADGLEPFAAEDTVDRKEIELLLHWVGKEEEELHKQVNSQGRAPPGTILTKLRAWFRAHEAE